ncbi:MAG: Omp28-related outer membrane protein [Chitinophagales bacterium]|nr:Omp28-related outer membrane protein [Chitinophagales bacterium]
MKIINIFFVIALGSYFLTLHTSCEEVGPPISFNAADTTLLDTTYMLGGGEIPVPQTKIVLLEDFTGQECPNCPDAHEIIADISAEHPGQLCVIAYYNYFADIFGGLPLVSDDAIDIGENFSATESWPAALIDRKDFEGDGEPLLDKNDYAASVDEQVSEIPSCNISIEKAYDETTRKLTVKITIIYTSAALALNHLSVALIENNIIAEQLDGLTEITDYIHNNVMRKFLTYYLGDGLSEINSAGRVYEKEFAYIIPAEWNADNIEIVAFVHHAEADNYRVLQAAFLE